MMAAMKTQHHTCILTLVIAFLLRFSTCWAEDDNQPGTREISLRMPDIRPDHGEQYLCMAHQIRRDDDGSFIVGFNPSSSVKRVHHMLMYGCEWPGIYQRDAPNFVWDCSSMHASSRPDQDQPEAESSFERGSVCRGATQILYGWAMDAPALRLPEGVGFKIGGRDSGIDFLVLQVHYGHHQAFDHLPGLTDNSGLALDIRANNGASGITKRAGVLLMSSEGRVLAGHSKHEIWCQLEEDIEIHPFRYRVHTHTLGVKVIGAKIGAGQRNTLGLKVDQAQIIGAGDPQQPQMFYPVRDASISLKRGDNIYASCEFNNNNTHSVKIGQTGKDEMCNFYLMYWTDGMDLLRDGLCITYNPQASLKNSWLEPHLE